MPDKPDIGSRIVLARQIKEWELTDLARVSGFDIKLVGQFERNEVTPNSAQLIELAKSLEQSLDFFFRQSLNLELKHLHVQDKDGKTKMIEFKKP